MLQGRRQPSLIADTCLLSGFQAADGLVSCRYDLFTNMHLIAHIKKAMCSLTLSPFARRLMQALLSSGVSAT